MITLNWDKCSQVADLSRSAALPHFQAWPVPSAAPPPSFCHMGSCYWLLGQRFSGPSTSASQPPDVPVVTPLKMSSTFFGAWTTVGFLCCPKVNLFLDLLAATAMHLQTVSRNLLKVLYCCIGDISQVTLRRVCNVHQVVDLFLDLGWAVRHPEVRSVSLGSPLKL